MEEEISEKSVGEIVATHYKTAAIFRQYNIDFCCNGGQTLSEVCAARHLKMEDLISQLEKVIDVHPDPVMDFNQWPLDLLTDYIEKKHHRYVENQVREIRPYLDKICRVHGDKHPELIEISELFEQSAGELARHMKKEELMLFPSIRLLVRGKESGNDYSSPRLGSVRNPIKMMMDEHDLEGARFKKIEKLSDHYTPPQDACNTYRLTLSLLKEFEDDLHIHIHLENNILFPKAVELEQRLIEK